jgi:hypothetical protein
MRAMDSSSARNGIKDVGHDLLRGWRRKEVGAAKILP